MRRRCNIEIVGGFLSWGKTSFINNYLQETITAGERVLVLQCEKGNTDISDILRKEHEVEARYFKNNLELNKKVLNRLINFHGPNRIIIETNGVQTVNGLVDVIESSKGMLGAVFVIVDGRIIETFIRSMGAIILSYIHRANMIIINNCGDISEEKVKHVQELIMELNKDAHILSCKSIKELGEEIRGSRVISKGIYKRIIDYFKNI